MRVRDGLGLLGAFFQIAGKPLRFDRGGAPSFDRAAAESPMESENVDPGVREDDAEDDENVNHVNCVAYGLVFWFCQVSLGENQATRRWLPRRESG